MKAHNLIQENKNNLDAREYTKTEVYFEDIGHFISESPGQL